MKEKFNEIRVFEGGDVFGSNFLEIEFVYCDSKLQKIKHFLSLDNRKTRSYHKEDKLVFRPKTYKDFINCLEYTDFNTKHVNINTFYEGLLSEHNYATGEIVFHKDNEPTSFKQLLMFACKIYKNKDLSHEQSQDQSKAFCQRCQEIFNNKMSKECER